MPSPKKRPPKRAARKRAPKAKKNVPRRSSWRWWLFWEVSIWGLGATLGVALAVGVLWHRAQQQVAAYLANPPSSSATPSVVWSAPIEVRAGQQATSDQLAADLLGAGYERVPELTGPRQFTAREDRVETWTGDTEGRVRVRFRGNQVVEVGGDGVLPATVLANFGSAGGRRDAIELDKLSPYVEPAVLAIEDSRFRSHRGIDPIGVGRALAKNLVSQDTVEGGSTLTQQLAKNLFLSSDRTLRRKVHEAFFAAALEARLDKDELLALYLGEVYLGQTGGAPIHGVEQASRAWFGVSAERLTLAQAATMAGVIAAPNRYTPLRHPDRARERRDVVLGRMEELGLVTSEAAAAARQEALVTHGSFTDALRNAPWAVDAAADQTETMLGDGVLAAGAYAVHTTVQPLLQRAAEQAIAQGLAELEMSVPAAAHAEAALVALDVSDGSIVAMVGGRHYTESAFNRATSAWRQLGSTAKPLVLLAALEGDEELTPLTRVMDEPVAIGNWSPGNADGQFKGDITVRQTLLESRNVPMLAVSDRIGREATRDFLRELGLSRATALPASILGAFETTPLELATAYSVFPGGGTVHEPHLLSFIVGPGGRRVHFEAGRPDRIASARSAAVATDLLQGVITSGTGAGAGRYGVAGPAGGKTGTSDDGRDAWFAGVTPELAVVVWVGADEGVLGVSGAKAALPIWSRFVVASGTLHGEFPNPPGVEDVLVCTETMERARPACEETTEVLMQSDRVSDVPRCHEHGALLELSQALRGLFRPTELRPDED